MIIKVFLFIIMQYDYLDTIAVKTADFFQNEKNLIKIPTDNFRFPLVLGSGNAIETGKILFRKNLAIFASESDASEKIAIPHIEEVVILSASGAKHAPILASQSKNAQKKTFLISSTPNSEASKIADESYIFPKITEPYTYNTSTYFGYIYGSEIGNYEPQSVKNFLENTLTKALENVNFSDFSSFFVVIPNEFSLLKNMIETKFIELFGRKIPRDIATYEQIKHAMTVIPDDGELFICFGNDSEKIFGKNQINLPIFDRENYGPMMLASYFTIGKIQRQMPNYFMENIASYCEKSEYSISPLVIA